MRWAMILAVLVMTATACEKNGKKAEPLAKAELLSIYYDGNERGGDDLWGLAGSGLGFLFRREGGKEACHLLFFSGKGREIALEKVLPVERKESVLLIGGVACGWDPALRAIILPKGRKLAPGDDGGMVLAALQESKQCRYSVEYPSDLPVPQVAEVEKSVKVQK